MNGDTSSALTQSQKREASLRSGRYIVVARSHVLLIVSIIWTKADNRPPKIPIPGLRIRHRVCTTLKALEGQSKPPALE